MFDGFGITGRIHAVLGATTVTMNSAMPWVVITRAKLGVAFWPNGKVQLHVSKARTTAAETAESIFLKHFAGRWVSKPDWEATIASNPRVVSCGVLGEVAKQHQGRFSH